MRYFALAEYNTSYEVPELETVDIYRGETEEDVLEDIKRRRWGCFWYQDRDTINEMSSLDDLGEDENLFELDPFYALPFQDIEWPNDTDGSIKLGVITSGKLFFGKRIQAIIKRKLNKLGYTNVIINDDEKLQQPNDDSEFSHYYAIKCISSNGQQRLLRIPVSSKLLPGKTIKLQIRLTQLQSDELVEMSTAEWREKHPKLEEDFKDLHTIIEITLTEELEMEKIIRICYGCKKVLTLTEAIAGQIALEIAMRNPNYDEFGGWHYHSGEPEFFIQAYDHKMLQALKLTINCDFIGGIHICFNCVEGAIRRYEEGRMKYVALSFCFSVRGERMFESTLLSLDTDEDEEARVLEYIDDFTHQVTDSSDVTQMEHFCIDPNVGDKLNKMDPITGDGSQMYWMLKARWDVYKQFRVF